MALEPAAASACSRPERTRCGTRAGSPDRVREGQAVRVEGPCLQLAPHGDPVLVAQLYVGVEIFEKVFLYPCVRVVHEGERSGPAAFDVGAVQGAGRGADVVAGPWPARLHGLVADPPSSVTTPTRGIF